MKNGLALQESILSLNSKIQLNIVVYFTQDYGLDLKVCCPLVYILFLITKKLEQQYCHSIKKLKFIYQRLSLDNFQHQHVSSYLLS